MKLTPQFCLTWLKANDKTHPQKQHAGRAVPPLVAEYAKVISMLLTDKPNMDSKNKLLKPLPNIPVGSKLLRTEAKGVQEGKEYVMYVLVSFMGLNNLHQSQNHSGIPSTS